MATKKKYYLVYRADNMETFLDDNAFICDTYEAAREMFETLVKSYITWFNDNYNGSVEFEVYDDNFDRAIFNSVEAKTDNVIVGKDVDGVRILRVENTEDGKYFMVWMDEQPREVITTKTRGKSSLF